MLERGRVRAGFEVGLGRGCRCKQRAHCVELLGTVTVRCAGDRDLPVGEVGPRPHERKHLQRLRGRAEERDPARIAGLGDDLPVLHRNGVDRVQRLDDVAAGYLDLDRVGHCRNTT